MEAYMKGKTDVTSDILELVESHYLPRIEEQQRQIKAYKKESENVVTRMFRLEEGNDKLKEGATA